MPKLGVKLKYSFFFLLLPLFLLANDLSWEPTEWIWNLGLAQNAHKGLDVPPTLFFKKDQFNKNSYKDITEKEILWVKSQFIKKFYKKVLPTIDHRFILIVSDGDESFPTDSQLDNKQLEQLIDHPMVIHIFAQNCNYQGPSPKVSHVPIGLDFHTLAYKEESHGWGPKESPSEQEQHLNELLKHLKPTHLRKKRIFVDFQHSNTTRSSGEFGEDRSSIFKRLQSTGLIDYGPRMPRSDLWKIKGEYAFSISPHGNGLDCHRTWEDLILGCIVIVKTSPLDPLYEGLPVVIVEDWAQVTEENLTKWLNQYKDAFTNPSYRSKLTNAYWLNKIVSKFPNQ